MTYSINDAFSQRQVVAYPEKRSFLSDLSMSELAFYFVMFYMVLGTPLGLTVGNIGVGFLMIVVLAICFVEGNASFAAAVGQVRLALGCGVGYILIQVLIHDQSLTELYLRPFGVWVLSLVVVQRLVGREQFLHRFAFMTLLLGLAMIPYMNVFQGQVGGAYQRIGLEKGLGFANPNDLGYWYGFCALYFSIAGFAARQTSFRLICWLLAIGNLLLVTLTVSRSPVIAVAGAIVVASRRILKEGFLPLLGLLGLAYGAIELGMFDAALQSYGLRAGEETGRLRVWPLLVERFLGSPLIGVGASHLYTPIPGGSYATPHNGFLLIAVSSGILPTVLFVGHWIKATKAALYATTNNLPDSMFHLPLLAYVFLVTNTGNLVFMAPWAMVALALPLSPHVSQRKV